MTPADILNLASGLILAILGLSLGALRWAEPVARGFAAFAVGLGGFYVVVAIPPVAHDLRPALLSGFALLIGGGLIHLMGVFPRPDPRTRPLFVASLVGALLVSVSVRVSAPEWFVVEGRGTLELLAGWAGTFARTVAPLAALFYFPILARRFGPGEATMARSAAIFAVGLALFVAGTAADGMRPARGEPQTAALAAFVALAFVGPTLLWALAARGPHARLHRKTALAYAAVFTAAVLIAPLPGDLAFPLGRAGGAVLLSYGVLGGLIEGLDVKVRFAIGKSTIAAVFIAVFFVASEAAQQFFGDTLGSTYVGIAAAGALVFAMAPLQRAAERLAEKAVPSADPLRGPTRAAHEDAYRAAVRLALRGGITRREEMDLARIADAHGIGAVRAHEIRDEVERHAATEAG